MLCYMSAGHRASPGYAHQDVVSKDSFEFVRRDESATVPAALATIVGTFPGLGSPLHRVLPYNPASSGVRGREHVGSPPRIRGRERRRSARNARSARPLGLRARAL